MKKNQSKTIIIVASILVLVLLLAGLTIFGIIRGEFVAGAGTTEYKDWKCSNQQDCINQIKAQGITDQEINTLKEKADIICSNYCIIKTK